MCSLAWPSAGTHEIRTTSWSDSPDSTSVSYIDDVRPQCRRRVRRQSRRRRHIAIYYTESRLHDSSPSLLSGVIAASGTCGHARSLWYYIQAVHVCIVSTTCERMREKHRITCWRESATIRSEWRDERAKSDGDDQCPLGIVHSLGIVHCMV